MVPRGRVPEESRHTHPEPVGAAREPVQLEEDAVEHHGEGQVEHGEKDFPVSGHHQADQGRHSRPQQSPQREEYQHVVETEPLDAEADRVRTDGIEHGVAEGHEIGSEKERDSQHGHELRHGQGHDELHPLRQDERHDHQEGRPSHREGPREPLGFHG